MFRACPAANLPCLGQTQVHYALRYVRQGGTFHLVNTHRSCCAAQTALPDTMQPHAGMSTIPMLLCFDMLSSWQPSPSCLAAGEASRSWCWRAAECAGTEWRTWWWRATRAPALIPRSCGWSWTGYWASPGPASASRWPRRSLGSSTQPSQVRAQAGKDSYPVFRAQGVGWGHELSSLW